MTETLSKCIPNIMQSEKKLIKWQCFLKAHKCFSLKSTQCATILQTEEKQEVTKTTDTHAAECSKAVDWGVK